MFAAGSKRFLQQRASLLEGEMRAGHGCNKNKSRPIPPLLGNGDAVDLFELFVHVKKRGGHDAITRDGLWEDVGEDQGLRCSGLGSAIKLIYYKYFLMSEKNLINIPEAVDSQGEPLYVDLSLDDSDLMRLASKDLKETENNEESSEEGSTDGGKLFDGKNDMDSDEVEMVEIDSISSDSSDNEIDSINQDVSKPDRVNDMVKVAKISSKVEDLSATKGDGSIAKRKRECALSKMLAWLDSVAKDPANPGIGTLPKSTYWKSYGNDHCWKQVLLTRGLLFHNKPHDSSPEQFSCQKKQKMHPSIFDDAGHSKVRSSPRLHLLGNSINHTKRIPVGPCFQAQVPEWSGVPVESESKWLGTRIWPPGDKDHVYALEEDPLQSPTIGSIECVRTHVSRRRMKLKVELGSAFKSWIFDKMGEEVASRWTKKEEKKFNDAVRENRWSRGKCFWSEMSKTLTTKTREELVSYYFNVFLLRLRANQNRHSLSNIDSDDDEAVLVS